MNNARLVRRRENRGLFFILFSLLRTTKARNFIANCWTCCISVLMLEVKFCRD